MPAIYSVWNITADPEKLVYAGSDLNSVLGKMYSFLGISLTEQEIRATNNSFKNKLRSERIVAANGKSVRLEMSR